MGDKAGEGRAYANLGCASHGRGNFRKAIEYHNLDLKIAKELGDKAGEGAAYGNLGPAFHCLGDYKKAIDNSNLHLEIAKEVGDKVAKEKHTITLAMLSEVSVTLKKPYTITPYVSILQKQAVTR